jgi:hypothetical protein
MACCLGILWNCIVSYSAAAGNGLGNQRVSNLPCPIPGIVGCHPSDGSAVHLVWKYAIDPAAAVVSGAALQRSIRRHAF